MADVQSAHIQVALVGAAPDVQSAHVQVALTENLNPTPDAPSYPHYVWTGESWRPLA